MNTRQQNNHVLEEWGSVTAKKTNKYKVTLVVNWINVYHAVVLNCRDFTSFFFCVLCRSMRRRRKCGNVSCAKLKASMTIDWEQANKKKLKNGTSSHQPDLSGNNKKQVHVVFLSIAFQIFFIYSKLFESKISNDDRLRASQQKSSKMEQALTNQTYQVTLKNRSMWFFFSLFLSYI